MTADQQAQQLSNDALHSLVADCEYHMWGAGQVTGHTLWDAYSDRRTAAKRELVRRGAQPCHPLTMLPEGERAETL